MRVVISDMNKTNPMDAYTPVRTPLGAVAGSALNLVSGAVRVLSLQLRGTKGRLAGVDLMANSGRNDGPPDLDELWRDFNQKLGGLFGGKTPGGRDGGGPRAVPWHGDLGALRRIDLCAGFKRDRLCHALNVGMNRRRTQTFSSADLAAENRLAFRATEKNYLTGFTKLCRISFS